LPALLIESALRHWRRGWSTVSASRCKEGRSKCFTKSSLTGARRVRSHLLRNNNALLSISVRAHRTGVLIGAAAWQTDSAAAAGFGLQKNQAMARGP